MLQTFPNWNYDSLPFRPDSNLQYTCTASVRSPAPSAVNNFTVVSYNIQRPYVILDLQWYPPSTPNGELGQYDICVGGEPLGPNEEQNSRQLCEKLRVSHIP